MSEFANIELTLITPSLTNPRKNFDATKLAELAEDIKRRGIDTPVTVRPLHGSRVADTDRTVQYELVCGERRLRASQLAGVATIPAMVRALTDEQALEVQLVENLQRADLAELEEAEGYETLMQHAGINADQVGERIGKSRSYVYARLKLLELSTECKQAMRDGLIDASRALLIARIPDSKLQLKALTEAQRKDYQGEVPSVRSLQTWLKQNVMLYLENASFKITDARLVAEAGSCKDCSKRTGANPDLFADVESADMCTDPVCFHGKEDAHRAKLRAQAEKKGIRLIEGAEAKAVFPNKWNPHPKGFSKLDQVRDDAKGEHRGKTLRELLGDDTSSVVLIENPHTKELIEAAPTEAVEAALIAKGLLLNEDEYREREDAEDEAEHAASGPVAESTGHLESHIERLKKQFEREQKLAQDKALLEATVQAVRDTDDKAAKALIGPDFLRAYLLGQVGEIEDHSMAVALGYTFADGEDEAQALAQHIKACSHADLARATVLVAMELESWFWSDDDMPPVKTALTKAMAVDLKAVQAKAVKPLKAKYTAEVRALQERIDAANAAKAEAAKADSHQLPAARPAEVAQAKAQPKKAKPKLSAHEATQGIAAAMQGIEGAASAPDGAVAPPQAATVAESLAAKRAELGIGLAIGTRIKVLAGKYKNKIGEVMKDMGSDCYQVKIKGVSAMNMFRADQMEQLQEEVVA
jgi:ParB/RepB/Spo0J family partition protein